MRRYSTYLSAASVLCAISLSAAVALAGGWRTFTIEKLETYGTDHYRVYTTTALPSWPSSCNKEFAEVYTSRTAEERELMNKQLLAAFLAGKQVELYISSASCGSTGHTAYAGVRILR